MVVVLMAIEVVVWGGRCRLLWKCTMVILFLVAEIRANLADNGGDGWRW